MSGSLLNWVYPFTGDVHVTTASFANVARRGTASTEFDSVLAVPVTHPYFTPSAFSIARHAEVVVQFVTSPNTLAVSGVP